MQINQMVRYIDRFNYADKCWWCGGVADSREHKYKKTDIVREYGNGPYRGGRAPVRQHDGKAYFIQGPNSKEAQFEKNICKNCNGARSQPFDRAYDLFQEHVRVNRESIIQNKIIRLQEVFGSDWNVQFHNIIKYYLKHICCRIVGIDIEIDRKIIDYLNGFPKLPHIQMQFVIREDVVALMRYRSPEGMDMSSFWLGDLHCILNTTHNKVRQVRSHIGYNWLWLYYVYDYEIGYSPAIYPDDKIELSTFYAIPPEKIEDGDFPDNQIYSQITEQKMY